MRTDSAPFSELNKGKSKEPRYTIEMSFDTANTDLHYFLSHKDSELPGTASSFHANVLIALSGTSQRIIPIQGKSSIGNIDFKVSDKNSQLTTLINTKLNANSGLRGKRVRVYVGYRGLAWDDYALVQTQIIEKISSLYDVYTFNCEDIQRQEKKDIFELKSTNIDATLTDSGITISVLSTTGFSTVEHGTSYTDAPNRTVGYVKIDEEIIRWTATTATTITVENVATTLDANIAIGAITVSLTSASGFPTVGLGYIDDGANVSTIRWTGISSGDLTGVTGVDRAYVSTDDVYYSRGRGALSSKVAEHVVDANADEDRQPTVEEYVYLEMPLVKMAYALLTGSLYNQEPAVLPSNWHLNISTSFIATSKFTGIGRDLWTLTDDTLGFVGRIEGFDKTDGKRFIEQEIYRLIALIPPVLTTGEIGLKRLSVVLPRSPYVEILDDKNIVSIGPLTHDMTQVHNEFKIDWNYVESKKRLTRRNVFIDAVSVTTHGTSKPLELKFRALHGNSQTSTTLASRFDALRDRYTGPPKLLNVTALHSLNTLEVGDIVRVQSANIRDYVGGGNIDSSFEVQQASIDWISGNVNLKLFGSSQASTSIASTVVATPLDPAFYTSLGTNLNTDPGGITTNLIGDVLHITTATTGTLTGNANMTLAGAMYFYTDDVVIDAGAIVNVTENVQFKIRGNFTVDGTINGVGGSTTSANTAGLFNAQAGGGINFDFNYNTLNTMLSRPAFIVFGADQYYYNLADSGPVIEGIPTDLRGTRGTAGIDTTVDAAFLGGFIDETLTGGASGQGGSGLAIICRGLSFGASGLIDLSGDPGAVGGTYVYFTNTTFYAGSGAGGAPGGLLVIKDGSAVTVTDLPAKLTANIGESPLIGAQPPSGRYTGDVADVGPVISSFYAGYSVSNLNNEAYREQFIPEVLTAEPDVSAETSVVPGLSLTVTYNVPQTPAENLATIDASVTNPTDGNYSFSNIYYKLSTQGDSEYLFAGRANTERSIVVGASGAYYDVIAKPVSIAGVESEDFTRATIFVVLTAGFVALGSGNYIAGGQTAYDTGDGFFFGNTGGTSQASIGDGGANSVTYNGIDCCVGDEAQVECADGYENNNIYYSTDFDSLDGWGETLVGSGSTSISINSSSLQLSAFATSDLARRYKFVPLLGVTGVPTWANSRKVKFILRKAANTGGLTHNFYCGSGTYLQRSIGFRADQNGSNSRIYARNHNGTSATETLIYDAVGLFEFKMEIVFNAGTNVLFYIDDTLEATHTTNLPSSASNSELLFDSQLRDVTGSGTLRYRIASLKFLQSP